MNNMAEYFPILKYKDGKLTRVNGTGLLIGGSYALFPLFSIYQEKFCDINISTGISINGENFRTRPRTIYVNNIPDLPDPCFLVATRCGGYYTAEEVESLNNIWNKLMSELKNEGWY